MAKGDHIYFNDYFKVIPYTHHGIDCGDGTVIHYTREQGVLRVSIHEFSQGKEIYQKPYYSCDSPYLVILRAESRLGEHNYDLIFNNCEHFATWCKTGSRESEQVKLILDVMDFFNWRMEGKERQHHIDLIDRQNKIIRKLEAKIVQTETGYHNRLQEKLRITNTYNYQKKASSQKPLEQFLITDNFDYRTLQLLLQEQCLQEADEFTFYAMLKISNREYDRYFRPKDISNFPREDLLIIDKLWREHSRHLFGFSIQKKIYQSLGGKQDYQHDIWEKFSEYVGWRVNEVPLLYEQLNFSMKAPKGHFPNGKRIGSEIIGFLAVI